MVDKLNINGVSVLICTYNGSQRMAATLKHLAEQIFVNSVPWEVILVDNNSSDDTQSVSVALWKQFGNPAPLRVLQQPRSGKQFALEMGYDAATYQYICIVDDDNWLCADYLQNGYDLLSGNPAIGILGGQNQGAFEVVPPDWFEKFKAVYAVGEPYAHTNTGSLVSGEVVGGVLWGAGLFIRHRAWQELKQAQFKSLLTGRQGEHQLTAGEDDELCHVVAFLGYSIWYDGRLQCTHYMTAKRLNINYLKKIYYASSRAYPVTSVYRRMMLPEWAKYLELTPWLRDWFYMFRHCLKAVLSRKYLISLWKKDILSQIRVNRMLLDFYYFNNFFFTTRSNFNKIVKLRQRLVLARQQ